ncbi:MAG TPA: septum site-determining protein MinC [Xanthobacteraceae bacterium]|nr:septum site-determining protein MinC [Xanthobacteraceae bacterium]
MRFRGRSYMAFVLTPEPPLADWLRELDERIGNSAGYFVGRPVVVDLSAVALSGAGIAHLVSELSSRDIRVMGLEGADPATLPPGLPPVLTGGRAASPTEPARQPAPAKAEAPRVASLLLDSPVRSGQSVIFPDGDVTVLGSIASGAEVLAGGSIHVYGALRGRALAGTHGNPSARIFCSRIEAELLAIDGYYRTADELDASLLGRRAQAWLADNALMIAALD